MVQGSTAQNNAVDVLRIIGSLGDALYSIDAASGDYDFVSAGFESLTGYTLDDIRMMGGRASFDIHTHADPPDTMDVASPVKRDDQGGARAQERWLRRKDGCVVCLEDRSGPVRDGDRTIAYAGVLRDITDRKKADESLRLFRSLIDQSSDSVIAVDPATGSFIDANETALRILGYSREEFTSMSLFDLEPVTTPVVYNTLSNELKKHGSAILNRPQRRKDGSTFPSEVSINLVHLDRDYVIASIRDISRRAEAEAALKQSEERFRLVSENVADLLAILDLNGICEFASPSHTQDGLMPDSIVGQNYLCLIHEEDVELVKTCIALVADGRGHQSTVFRFRRADGSWRHKDASITLIVDDAGARLLTVARDITERIRQDEDQRSLERQLSERNARLEKTIAEVRQMQEGLIQSEKMASIGQLTAGIAHEINNPLAFVSSNLNRFNEYFNELLGVVRVWQAMKADLASEPKFHPLLALIEKTEAEADLDFVIDNFSVLMKHTAEGTERIRSIVDRLRGFSHMATSSFAEADINAAIDDTINLTWNELKYKATIVREYGDIPPVTCNIGEINQVLVNLLVNAAHALTDKGTITIRTAQKDNAVVIHVIDTGAGIPESHLKRIFDPFFTTKPVGKGTGLGLWISATIVQKHAGSLTVESEPGTGTTMSITLPLSHESAPEGAS